VFIIWNVNRQRPYLRICHTTRDRAEAFMEDILQPYSATDAWRRKLRVAGPMKQERSWRVEK
jgi:hypothetical protein